MKNLYVLMTLLFLGKTVAQKNEKIDGTTYAFLQQKVRLLSASNLDSAMYYTEKIKLSGSGIHQAFAYAANGYLYNLKSKKSLADQNFIKAFQLLSKEVASKEKELTLSYLYNYKGATEWYRGNLSKALESYQKGEKYSLKYDDVEQLIKFKINIALLKGETGKFQSAIDELKKANHLIDIHKKRYDLDEYLLNKSNVNLNIGRYYHLYFEQSKKQTLLDTAKFYFKTSLRFSENFDLNRSKALNNLATIEFKKGNYTAAEQIYLEVLEEAKAKNELDDVSALLFNLGALYYKMQEENKALYYLKQVDSLYRAKSINLSDYTHSNYLQSKIYSHKKSTELASKHATIYLDNYELLRNKNESERLTLSSEFNNEAMEEEMTRIRHTGTTAYYVYGLYFLLLVGLSFVLYHYVKIKKQKNILESDFQYVLEESIVDCGEQKLLEIETVTTVKPVQLIIDEKTERQILNRFEKLMKDEQYLNKDFTLPYVSKKIKTNTTYLSYLVKKKYEKSFSELVNEYKINFIIQKMISDATFRKYSTQAIAESAGFKQASSFSRSFSKKTGLTPTQFIQKLEQTVGVSSLLE